MSINKLKTIYLKDYQEPDYYILHTNLNIELNEEQTFVTSELKIELNINKHNKGNQQPKLSLDGEQLELIEIAVDGNQLREKQYTVTEKQLIISVDTQRFILKTKVKIQPQNNTSLEGLYKSKTMFCSQCEAEGFRKITWYLDRPDVMSLFTTTIIANQKQYPILLSNGNLVKQRTLEDGRHWVTWEDPFKKPSYLFAVVAGNLDVITDEFITKSGKKVTLKIYSEPHNITQCGFALEALKKAMKWDEQKYGREYDLDIFMIVAVEDFNMGAMENKGLNIFNVSCVLASPETATDSTYHRVEGVVAHEYFHNWSGNRVTCRDWFQLSLKEGFTVYRDATFSQDMGIAVLDRINNVNFLRNIQFVEDAGPMAHPVRPASFIEISNFYTVTVYEKGAEVVGMLHTLLGPEGFRKGTDLYFERHDGEAVTCDDFIKAMENANNKDFSQFKLWYSQAGTPTLKVTDSYNTKDKCYRITFEQILPDTPDQPGNQKKPMHIPIGFGLIYETGEPCILGDNKTNTTLEITDQKQSFEFYNIVSKPIPSILRSFSAPVKIEYNYSNNDLVQLMQYDEDDFNRWDSGQKIFTQDLLYRVACIQNKKKPSKNNTLAIALKTIIEANIKNYGFLAQLLSVPSESIIADQMKCVDVDAIHLSCRSLKQEIGLVLESPLQKLYQNLNNPKGKYEYKITDVSKRALKNTALSLLCSLEKVKYIELAVEQFNQANNMTDKAAAIACLVAVENSDFLDVIKKALDEFMQQWKHDSNVLNSWFSMQSTSVLLGKVDQIEALLNHELFDIKNPNRIRSVLGAFSNNNPTNFHHKQGKGYALLAQSILKLDDKNPQIAASLMRPLLKWKRYDLARQSLMNKEILYLKNNVKSPDVYELVNKALQ